MTDDGRKDLYHHGRAGKHFVQDSRVKEERLVNLPAYASNVALEVYPYVGKVKTQ